MEWLSPRVATIDGSFNIKFVGINSLTGETFTYYANNIEKIITTINVEMFETFIINRFRTCLSKRM